MPSGWFWDSIVEMLVYGSSVIVGAQTYCGVHVGTTAAIVLPWFDSVHVWVLCVDFATF